MYCHITFYVLSLVHKLWIDIVMENIKLFRRNKAMVIHLIQRTFSISMLYKLDRQNIYIEAKSTNSLQNCILYDFIGK